jgi:hypothetical protein
MELTAFRASLAGAAPPPGLSRAAQALWWDAKGDWDRAHDRAQAQDDAAGAAVHAYLHRKEGDAGNAAYWYRRAGRRPSGESLEQEWAGLVGELVANTEL